MCEGNWWLLGGSTKRLPAKRVFHCRVSFVLEAFNFQVDYIIPHEDGILCSDTELVLLCFDRVLE